MNAKAMITTLLQARISLKRMIDARADLPPGNHALVLAAFVLNACDSSIALDDAERIAVLIEANRVLFIEPEGGRR